MDFLQCTPEEWHKEENEWLKNIEHDSVWNKIPLLNANELHNLPDSRLVRFRGMIQDMHGPEFYLERFEIVNINTLEKSIRHGKYVDVIDYSKETEMIGFMSDQSIRNERQSYVVVSVPAVNGWVKEVEKEKFHLPTEISSTPSTSSSKRHLDIEMETDDQNDSSSGEGQPKKGSSPSKKQCTSQTPAGSGKDNLVISPEHIQNLPIPDPSGKVCHVKVYKTDCDDLKLNTMFEFVGFLSVSPQLVSSDGVESDENDMEYQTRNPPPSLVPRIHCVSYKAISHNNPLVVSTSDGGISDGGTNMAADRMLYVKKELQILLTQLLLGDEIAAEYLIYHLMSEVYLRRDLMALGKFSLNISNVPTLEGLDYVQELYNFIELFVTKSHYLPMSLENMNELAFIPKKDYECNRLTSSILQLSPNTHLVLDETKLTPGKLNEAGINGLKALNNVIKNQKTMFDFRYYQTEYDCDIPVLIFSEGKSMLQSDCHVVLQPDELHLNTFKEILEAAKHFLKPELLNEIRIYLTLARMVKYEMSENVQELIQRDFVDLRQKENITADDLHTLLVLARLVCISQGKSTLDEECWNRASFLEKARKDRLPKA